MSVNITFDGQPYIIPETGETGWGGNTTSYLVAIAAGCLQKTGGSFTLSAEIDFGISFGLRALSYRSRNTNPALSGIFRLGNTEGVKWRNAANSADLDLSVNAFDQIIFNGVPLVGSTLTANRALISNGSGIISPATTTDTEIGFVNGVTSAIQTQLNAKSSTELDNLGTTAINASLIPDASIFYDIGTPATLWAAVFARDLQAGKSGAPGTLRIYPVLSDRGFTSFFMSSNAGNTPTSIEIGSQAAIRTYTISDVGASADFVMTAGNQTIAGIKTFSAAAVFDSTITPTGGFTTPLKSDTDNNDDLGTNIIAWKDLFIDGSIKHGNAVCITMNSIGATTQATQPSFSAFNTVNDSNATGDGTDVTVDFNSVVFDLNANFANDTFTAPLLGKYNLITGVALAGIVSGHTGLQIRIVTSNRIYQSFQNIDGTLGELYPLLSTIADMDANDTAIVTVTVSGGTKVVIIAGNSTTLRTYFSGALLH